MWRWGSLCEDRIFQKGKAFKGFYNSMDLLVFSKYSILESVHRKKKSTYDECHKRLFINGDSAATRTQNLLLRRQLLYPVELRNHPRRDSLIRTGDLLLPKQAR